MERTVTGPSRSDCFRHGVLASIILVASSLAQAQPTPPGAGPEFDTRVCDLNKDYVVIESQGVGKLHVGINCKTQSTHTSCYLPDASERDELPGPFEDRYVVVNFEHFASDPAGANPMNVTVDLKYVTNLKGTSNNSGSNPAWEDACFELDEPIDQSCWVPKGYALKRPGCIHKAEVKKAVAAGQTAEPCYIRLRTYDMAAAMMVEASTQDIPADSFRWPVDTDGDSLPDKHEVNLMLKGSTSGTLGSSNPCVLRTDLTVPENDAYYSRFWDALSYYASGATARQIRRDGFTQFEKYRGFVHRYSPEADISNQTVKLPQRISEMINFDGPLNTGVKVAFIVDETDSMDPETLVSQFSLKSVLGVQPIWIRRSDMDPWVMDQQVVFQSQSGETISVGDLAGSVNFNTVENGPTELTMGAQAAVVVREAVGREIDVLVEEGSALGMVVIPSGQPRGHINDYRFGNKVIGTPILINSPVIQTVVNNLSSLFQPVNLDKFSRGIVLHELTHKTAGTPHERKLYLPQTEALNYADTRAYVDANSLSPPKKYVRVIKQHDGVYDLFLGYWQRVEAWNPVPPTFITHFRDIEVALNSLGVPLSTPADYSAATKTNAAPLEVWFATNQVGYSDLRMDAFVLYPEALGLPSYPDLEAYSDVKNFFSSRTDIALSLSGGAYSDRRASWFKPQNATQLPQVYNQCDIASNP